MAEERRFSGRLAEEYELLELAYPDFRSFQQQLVSHVERLPAGSPLLLLEIGAGKGFTTDLVLQARSDVTIDAVDNEPAMISQLKEKHRDAVRSDALRPVERDALEFVREQEEGRYDAFFSAFTLHNLHTSYREKLLPELFRVLKPGGLFVNADKYAPDGQAQFDALETQLGRFFDAFVPLGKYELLRDWVLHNVMDQSPQRCQRESEAVAQLEQVGFRNVAAEGRSNMQAVVVAGKPA